MVPVVCSQVEVYVFRRRAARAEVLIPRRSPERTLPGVWQPVTGGIERAEPAYSAAAREVLEETGLTPLRWWALSHLTSFYEPARNEIRLVPGFAAQVAVADPVQLSPEHDRYAFVSLATASRRVLWDTQRHSLAALAREVLRGGAHAEARDVTARIMAARTRRRRMAPAR